MESLISVLQEIIKFLKGLPPIADVAIGTLFFIVITLFFGWIDSGRDN